MARGPKRAPWEGLVEGLIEMISLHVVVLTTVGSLRLCMVRVCFRAGVGSSRQAR